MRDDHIAEDFHSWAYPHGMNKWAKFWEFVFPWFILIGLVVGIYFMFMYGLEFMVELSKPVNEFMVNNKIW